MKTQGKCDICGLYVKCFDATKETCIICNNCGIGVIKLKEKK